jgi:hypothetical protein
MNHNQRPDHLRPFSVTISKAGYESAKANIPKLPGLAEMCLRDCLIHIQAHPNISSGIELYFDQGTKPNEPYLSILNDARKNCNGATWMSHILSTASVDSRKHCAVQAADMFSWASHHYWSQAPTRRLFNYSLGAQLFQVFHDKIEIERLHDENGAIRRGAVLRTAPIQSSAGYGKPNEDVP